mmetsp:Transcript_32453/g.71216  ORF Transcript_32453/g.71216 Transcript_32453/m.71216 type:complete len:245 (-) Transcript_32453:525-1259(-)
MEPVLGADEVSLFEEIQVLGEQLVVEDVLKELDLRPADAAQLNDGAVRVIEKGLQTELLCRLQLRPRLDDLLKKSVRALKLLQKHDASPQLVRVYGGDLATKLCAQAHVRVLVQIGELRALLQLAQLGAQLCREVVRDDLHSELLLCLASDRSVSLLHDAEDIFGLERVAENCDVPPVELVVEVFDERDNDKARSRLGVRIAEFLVRTREAATEEALKRVESGVWIVWHGRLLKCRCVGGDSGE